MPEKIFVSVILPLRLDWDPLYSAPPEYAGALRPGSRVWVRFAGKKYLGTVSGTGIDPASAAAKKEGRTFKINDIEEISNLAAISPEEIELWREIAAYYMCTVGEVYKAAYPGQRVTGEEKTAARQEREEERQRKTEEKRNEATAKRLKAIRERIALRETRLEGNIRNTTRSRLETEIAELRERERRLENEAKSTYVAAAGPDGDISVTDGTLPDIDTAARTDTSPIAENMPVPVNMPAAENMPVLSPAQQKAYDLILESFSKGKPALLNGVTGSGKTEIYVTAAAYTMDRGRTVLYLVPEIALSRQLEDRLRKFFQDRLVCFHSGITQAAKEKACEKVRESRSCIVLGTRSAVFLPLNNLGLVIIDEEHDRSYKQDSPAPRYNGRDAAMILANSHKSNVLLGTATPSFESAYNCATGRYTEVTLDERFHGPDRTETIVIDTTRERKRHGMVGSISRELIRLIKETVSDGGQAMLLRARKSYATTVQCSVCGSIVRCPRCNVSLTLSKAGNGRLVCSHCGYSVPWNENLPHPGPDGICTGRLEAFGAGTEKIEEEIAEIFPEYNVGRLDSDIAAGSARQKEIIRDFAAGRTDILVGTQMLAKGFDFDRLSLVAVLQADSMLGQQDFRADEKAVQLLEQFRGRCARRGQKGIFAIQTAQAQHPVYRMFTSKDTSGLKSSLIEERKEFGYPPYTRIINLVLKDPNLPRLQRVSAKLSLMLRSDGVFPGRGVEVSAAFAPVVDRINDEHIRMIRLTLPRDSRLKANKDKLKTLLDGFCRDEKYGGRLVVDVDPA